MIVNDAVYTVHNVHLHYKSILQCPTYISHLKCVKDDITIYLIRLMYMRSVYTPNVYA